MRCNVWWGPRYSNLTGENVGLSEQCKVVVGGQTCAGCWPAQYIAAAGAGASTPVSLASTTLALHN